MVSVHGLYRHVLALDIACVYQKLRFGRSGDAVHRGEHVT
jgi:hypothetical protein